MCLWWTNIIILNYLPLDCVLYELLALTAPITTFVTVARTLLFALMYSCTICWIILACLFLSLSLSLHKAEEQSFEPGKDIRRHEKVTVSSRGKADFFFLKNFFIAVAFYSLFVPLVAMMKRVLELIMRISFSAAQHRMGKNMTTMRSQFAI